MTEALTLRQRGVLRLARWAGLEKLLPALTAIHGHPYSGGGWAGWIRESYTGAWQQNVVIELPNVLSHPTVFACVTLIASDIAKMALRLVELTASGVWVPTESAAFSPVLRRPNPYQTTGEFIRQWVINLLIYGNAYILLRRDARQVVVAMYPLDPCRVQAALAPDGSIYYNLKRDDLSRQFEDGFVVPASEIIHDKINTLWHPLCGLSPIYASGLAAVLGLRIETNSATLFGNSATPSGILLAPTAIDQDQANRLKANFQAAISGANFGAVAVLTNGLDYKPITHTAVDSQLIDQWRATSEAICSTFHVPGYMVGVGPPPNVGSNIQALNIQYFAQALQQPVENIQALIDHALGIDVKMDDGRQLGVEFDKDDLLWMDTATLVENEAKKVGAAIASPNEARKKLNALPVEGGETPYLQEQNWPIAMLANRELPTRPPTPPAPMPPPEDEDVEVEDEEMDDATAEASLTDLLRKEMAA